MPTYRRTAVVSGSIVLVAGFLVWALHSERERRNTIQVGHNLYLRHCASCHGVNLQGQADWQTPNANGRLPAPPHDVSGHTWHHSDQELFRITKFGMSAVVPDHVSDMPGFEGVLSDAEIEAVLTFIKSTWPQRERTYQRERTEAAQEK